MKPTPIKIALLIAAALLGVSWWMGKIPSPLSFNANLLTQVVPDLFAALFVMAAVSERATAVINDIWFGEERMKRQEAVRAKGKEYSTAVLHGKIALDAHAKIAVESVRAGAISGLDDITQMASVKLPNAGVEAIAADLKKENDELASLDGQAARTRLRLSFVTGLLFSFFGVRVLGTLLAGPHSGFFQLVDIVLTAGVLAGGTTAINAISDLIGGYVHASRKRALEAG
ncbi:hypothetical protein [Sinorhizobium meliloti]|uniref:hypothetical protein n=1 Tax=Rhizobium meliloti TaxID=382 RepID=UPI000FDA9B35|nr:hypothetical protein [Sinorhizobium meliloti]RVK27622.1 hypothetical protein CN163_30655 [Sinorhizobium meliloti]